MGRQTGLHRNLDPIYAFPDRRLVKHLVRDLPLRASALRTLGAYANVFAIESFMDAPAEAAGMNAVAFRLRHLADERARKVLEAAATHLGWAGTAPAPGRGPRIAFQPSPHDQTYASLCTGTNKDTLCQD